MNESKQSEEDIKESEAQAKDTAHGANSGKESLDQRFYKHKKSAKASCLTVQTHTVSEDIGNSQGRKQKCGTITLLSEYIPPARRY